VHRYIKYNLKKKKEVTRAAGPLCLPYHPLPLGPTCSFVVGFYPRHWVLPLHPWVLPFVIGSYPLSLGPTLCCWALPFVVGPYPLLLGPTLRHWALPFVIGPYHSFIIGPYHSSAVGPYHSSLGPTIHHWAFVVVFYALRNWVYPFGLVLPFAIGFYPLRAAGAITFMWLDTRAAGATTFMWFGIKAAGAKGGRCERRQV